jgi:type III restriction enzyme
MPQNFLYEQLDSVSKMGFLKKEIPSFVVENLNSNFELREYQKEAFARFFHCYNNDFENKEYPLHFLFNMATGSGKTLIMAGLILYLYEKGYCNFIFFVNSNNIIEKTKDNFLNNFSRKYLFNDKIVFRNKEVKISKVDNFEGISKGDINICFTTIQKMHGDLHNEKENSLTFEDFKDKKIVLLSDEAHHGQVKTKNGELFEKPNWENTVEKIFKQNNQNLLLEFTATMDFLDKNIIDKYLDKIIYRYDLKEFRNDGFSKDPELLSADTNRKDRIIQAIILSEYRQEVAGKNGIDLKPVILFKAQKTIAESQDNKKLFHEIIENLSVNDIENIQKRADAEVLKKAFNFFKENKITNSILSRKLKNDFAENKTLSVNDEPEKEKYQLLINSLEDKNNQIRAIFAVQKLNEGWDVLNLFDIVRLYEKRDGKAGKPGKTTISEAQLIGRGARYFPFGENGEKYKRKYDKNLDNELRILEELHYHSHNDSKYISEIKIALREEGMLDEDAEEVKLELKEEFKKSAFYKSGLVFANKKIKRSFEKVQTLDDLGVSQKSIKYRVYSGIGDETSVFQEELKLKSKKSISSIGIKLKNIEKHIIQNALAKNDSFLFSNLKQYFQKIKSIDEFIDSYLADLEIIFEGIKIDLENISSEIKIGAIIKLFNEIETQIKNNLTEYTGSEEFFANNIHQIFTDKKIKIKKGNERLNGQIEFLRDKKWYAYDANYGTSEEKDFVEFIDRNISDLKKQFREAYLIRNERQLKIFNFSDGQAFEPDYVLFLIDKKGKNITYQLFLEPKGLYLMEHDKWKNDFLEEIRDKFKNKIIEFGKSKKYKIVGAPFYSKGIENEFKEKLLESLT